MNPAQAASEIPALIVRAWRRGSNSPRSALESSTLAGAVSGRARICRFGIPDAATTEENRDLHLAEREHDEDVL